MSQLVERCPCMYHGLQCALPKGHGGDHESSIPLPPDVGMMIEQHVSALEAQTKAMKRTRNWMLGIAALNMVTALYSILAILIHYL